VRLLIALTGIALGLYLVADYGWKDVLAALQAVSWAGLGGITLFHGLPTLLCGLAWWALLRPHSDENWFLYFWLRWVRGSIDGIVPVLPLSGELVATRILSLRRTAFAGAGIVVDLSAELIAQLLFAVLGFALLIASHPASHHLVLIALGIGVMTAQFGGFFVAQKKGLFRIVEHPLDWIRRRRGRAESKADRTLHDQILQIHAHHRAVMASILLHFAAWVVGAAEGWIGLRLMGHPLTITGALILESLVSAARGVVFFVPLNAGVQEGAYVLVGSLLGLPADLALALSLLKRARDLIKGVPALLTWQLIESRDPSCPAERLLTQRSP
jgi:glycosyltransferase 2 family protein